MKNYAQGDYAINKNAKGIVYPFSTHTLEVTLEDYLRENPDKTAADFAELKALSDADYYQTDRSDYRQTCKNISLNTLDDDKSNFLTVPSAEDEFIENWEHEETYAKRKSHVALVLDKLTEVQRRRYLMHHVDGLTTQQIADKEDVNQSKIVDSLKFAEKKIQKYFMKVKK